MTRARFARLVVARLLAGGALLAFLASAALVAEDDKAEDVDLLDIEKILSGAASVSGAVCHPLWHRGDEPDRIHFNRRQVL